MDSHYRGNTTHSYCRKAGLSSRESQVRPSTWIREPWWRETICNIYYVCKWQLAKGIYPYLRNQGNVLLVRWITVRTVTAAVASILCMVYNVYSRVPIINSLLNQYALRILCIHQCTWNKKKNILKNFTKINMFRLQKLRIGVLIYRG